MKPLCPFAGAYNDCRGKQCMLYIPKQDACSIALIPMTINNLQETIKDFYKHLEYAQIELAFEKPKNTNAVISTEKK